MSSPWRLLQPPASTPSLQPPPTSLRLPWLWPSPPFRLPLPPPVSALWVSSLPLAPPQSPPRVPLLPRTPTLWPALPSSQLVHRRRRLRLRHARPWLHAPSPLVVYQRRRPAPAPEPSRVGSSVYHPIAVARDPRNTHPMVIRHAVGVTKPVDHLQLSASAAPPTVSGPELCP
jgi:hypothetical protein